jgi:hypothetical protein
MLFSPGTRLGPYEVSEPLGAGGMGEAYRARATRGWSEPSLSRFFPRNSLQIRFASNGLSEKRKPSPA